MFVAKVKCGKLNSWTQYAVCWTTRKGDEVNGELVSNVTIRCSETDARNECEMLQDDGIGSHQMYCKVSSGDLDQLWINPMTACKLTVNQLADGWFYATRYTTAIGDAVRLAIAAYERQNTGDGATVP